MRRPAGITIIAVLALAIGVIDVLEGLRDLGYVVFGPGQVLSNASLTGWLTLIVGVVWLVIAGGFFSLQPWAWLLAVIWVGVSLIEAFFGSLNNWQLGSALFAMAIPLIILAWLNSGHVKAAFKMEG